MFEKKVTRKELKKILKRGCNLDVKFYETLAPSVFVDDYNKPYLEEVDLLKKNISTIKKENKNLEENFNLLLGHLKLKIEDGKRIVKE